MRAMALALAAVCLFAYACSEDSVDPAERAAAEVVNAHLEDDAPKSYIPPGTLINLEEHKSDCAIGEGSTTGVEPMPARCEWKTREEGEETLVDLIETWKCSEFNERAGREDFCRDKEGFHQWRWAINEAKELNYLGDTGDALAESFYLPSD